MRKIRFQLPLALALSLLVGCGLSVTSPKAKDVPRESEEQSGTPADTAATTASPTPEPSSTPDPTPTSTPDPSAPPPDPSATPPAPPAATPLPPVSLSLSGPTHVMRGDCAGPFTVALQDAGGNPTETGEDLPVALSGQAKAEIYRDIGCSQIWAQGNGSPVISANQASVQFYRKISNATSSKGKETLQLAATTSGGTELRSLKALDLAIGGVQVQLDFPLFFQTNHDPACDALKIYNKVAGYGGCGNMAAATGFFFPSAGAAAILSNPPTAPGVFFVTACIAAGSSLSVVCVTP